MKKLTLCLISLALLQGCAAVGVVAVVGGASLIKENRTIGKIVDDEGIELKAHSALAQEEAIANQTNLHCYSINGSVLVVGQAPSVELRDLAIKKVSAVTGVVRVHDQIRLGNTTSVTTRSNDLWLTTKVKTTLFTDYDLDANNIKVITENGEVFLMGLLTRKNADEVVEITRNISGVDKVFKVFEYIED